MPEFAHGLLSTYPPFAYNLFFVMRRYLAPIVKIQGSDFQKILGQT